MLLPANQGKTVPDSLEIGLRYWLRMENKPDGN
jgi:hypothetical protein